ncbi:MAG: flavodoxin family protein [Candidatus Lokiarchaeota archaeon]|nr:flavodoxin family protein [Candidatus Lokiarchaeota archaeon]
MKVIAFNGSARKKGNTYQSLQVVLEVLNNEGIETELVQLADKDISHCLGCYKCAGKKKCVTHDDDLNDLVDMIVKADGILLGSPTYFANASSKMKALIDRSGIISKVNGDLYKRKVGAAVVAVRRQGACHVFSSLNYFFLINQMVVPGSSYWNLAIGKDPGDVKDDDEGIQTFKNLGKNMAWLLKKLK